MKFSSRRLAVKLPNMCKRNDFKFDNSRFLCLRPFGVTNVFSLSENNVYPEEANFAPKINLYLTIIRRRQGEYCRIIPETKSRGLFDNIHRA